MTFTPITVTGSWRKPGPDGGEQPSSGQVTFQLYQALSDDDATILPRTRVVVPLNDAGDISVILAATDDPTTTPAGVPYEVVELVDKVQRRYFVEIPHAAAGGTVDLATLQPMTPLPPAVDPTRIPPDPTGQANGLVVTVENGVYTLQPGGGAGYTGPVELDLRGATPVDNQVAVDLSELPAGASSVTIYMPTSGSPLIAQVTMPPVERGPLPLIAVTSDGLTSLAIWTDSPFGPFPLTSQCPSTAAALATPASFPSIGDVWIALPPPGFDPGGLLQPSQIVDTVTAVAQAVEDDTGIAVDPTFVQSMSDAFVAQVVGSTYMIDQAVRNMNPVSSVLLQAAFTASVLAVPAPTTVELVPVTVGDTWNGVITTPTFNLPANVILSRIAIANGGAVNVIPSGLDPGQQMRVVLIVYNGYGPNTGGTIGVELNGVELARAEDIPVGSARAFQVAAKNVGGTITAVADYGTTIPNNSPDY